MLWECLQRKCPRSAEDIDSDQKEPLLLCWLEFLYPWILRGPSYSWFVVADVSSSSINAPGHLRELESPALLGPPFQSCNEYSTRRNINTRSSFWITALRCYPSWLEYHSPGSGNSWPCKFFSQEAEREMIVCVHLTFSLLYVPGYLIKVMRSEDLSYVNGPNQEYFL